MSETENENLTLNCFSINLKKVNFLELILYKKRKVVS